MSAAQTARRLECRAARKQSATAWAQAAAIWALLWKAHRELPNSTARWLNYYRREQQRCAFSAVKLWNEKHPQGTEVSYWTLEKVGPGRRGRTRSAAWLVSGPTPVVLVTGASGGVALTHVELAPSASASKEAS